MQAATDEREESGEIAAHPPPTRRESEPKRRRGVLEVRVRQGPSGGKLWNWNGTVSPAAGTKLSLPLSQPRLDIQDVTSQLAALMVGVIVPLEDRTMRPWARPDVLIDFGRRRLALAMMKVDTESSQVKWYLLFKLNHYTVCSRNDCGACRAWLCFGFRPEYWSGRLLSQSTLERVVSPSAFFFSFSFAFAFF